MHTARTILALVVAIALAAIGVTVALVALLGVVAGLLVAFGLLAVIVAHYGLALRPWHRRWGATDAEAHGPLPGDDLVPDASTTTRVVAVAAPPEAVWPWLVQIGWGRGGWYSYDWIDNDRRPSAGAIVAELQDLAVGDRLPMTPDAAFVVQTLDPPRTLVALAEGGTTSWCLHVTPEGDGSRLVSRFRDHTPLTPASALWRLISDPGVFVMERKMLMGIAARAEAHADATPAADGVEVEVTGARHRRPGPVHAEDAEHFLEGHRIAVIGASDTKGNMGAVIVRELGLHGHEAVPVHPTAPRAGGQRCHATIGDVPGPVDGAVVAVPGDAAVDAVRQCIDAGIGSIWLFKGIGGEGALSAEAVEVCHEAGVEVVPGACPLMFLEPVGALHRFHRLVRRADHGLVEAS